MALSHILGRPLGHSMFSLIGSERIIFRNIFQRVFRAIMVYISPLGKHVNDGCRV